MLRTYLRSYRAQVVFLGNNENERLLDEGSLMGELNRNTLESIKKRYSKQINLRYASKVLYVSVYRKIGKKSSWCYPN